MNDAPPTTTYVSRVLALPSGVARQVFDACRVDRQHRSADPDHWTVTAGATLLRVTGPGHVPGASRLGPVRSCPAALQLPRRGGTVPVELELTPWSHQRTEVGLRLLGRRAPRRGYLDAAGACVDALVNELELRGLLALHPAHGAGDGAGTPQEAAASAWL